MTGVEQQVAQTLRRAAEQAPSDVGLLTRVQGGVVRRRRRRTAGAALLGSTAVVVALALALGPGGRTTLQYGAGPFFVANPAVATFPYTPAGLPREPLLIVTPTESTLTWTQAAGSVQVVVSTRRPSPDPLTPGRGSRFSRSTVAVRGTEGTLSCALDVASCRLSWPEAGRWLRVDTSRTAPLRARPQGVWASSVAAGLRDTTYRPREQLHVGLVPRACSLAQLAPDALSLGGPSDLCQVSVALVPDLGYPGTPTRYGGRPALEAPAHDAGLHQVFVRYPGTDVSILVPRAWTRAQLDALVRSLVVRAQS